MGKQISKLHEVLWSSLERIYNGTTDKIKENADFFTTFNFRDYENNLVK